MKNNKPLRCPFCHKELVRGKQCKFETLSDHVSDPNMEDYPLRDTFICTCKESKDSFWDVSGDFYTKAYNYHSKSTFAINSWAREFDEEYEKRDRLKRTWIGRLYLKIYDKCTISLSKN